MLLDTSGLLALHDRGEASHAAACESYRPAKLLVTHNYVLAEFVALTHARRLARAPTLEFLDDLLAHPRIEVVWVDQTLHNDAQKLLKVRLDKSYSLCDAVSFVLMRRSGIQDALTTDHHFEQEGFRRLLK